MPTLTQLAEVWRKERSMRLIDADALKDKLQQHHDFYVMAWGGFGKMPIGEKKRVDEITNCIAEVVNTPTIEPKRGEWICHEGGWIDFDYYPTKYECNQCHHYVDVASDKNFCPNCGADMRNCSEKPNNCETEPQTICKGCVNYPCESWQKGIITDKHNLIDCVSFKPKDEPFDKDINARSKYKQGTWLYGDGVYCSCCGYKLETTALLAKCPKCGADMSKTDCAWK